MDDGHRSPSRCGSQAASAATPLLGHTRRQPRPTPSTGRRTSRSEHRPPQVSRSEGLCGVGGARGNLRRDWKPHSGSIAKCTQQSVT